MSYRLKYLTTSSGKKQALFCKKQIFLQGAANQEKSSGPFCRVCGFSAERFPYNIVQHRLHGVDVVGFAFEDGRIAHRHAHAAEGGDALVDLPLGAAGHFRAGEDGVEQFAHQRLGLAGGFDLVQPRPDEAALQKAEQQGVLPQGLDDVIDHEDHLVREAVQPGGVLTGGHSVVQQLIAHPRQQRLGHRALVGKVEIERALADLCAGGDLLYAGLGSTPLQKQLICGVQKRPALLLLFAFHGAHALSRFLFSSMFCHVHHILAMVTPRRKPLNGRKHYTILAR